MRYARPDRREPEDFMGMEAYTSAVRLAYRAYDRRPMATRLVVANLFASRSVAIEFGPAS